MVRTSKWTEREVRERGHSGGEGRVSDERGLREKEDGGERGCGFQGKKR